jgi:beta-glucosidase
VCSFFNFFWLRLLNSDAMLAATKTTPSLDYDIFTADGRRGWTGAWYSHAHATGYELGALVAEQLIDETRIFISTSAPAGITPRWTLKLRGQLKPRERDCTFEFGLIVAGRAKVGLSCLSLFFRAGS